MRRLLIAIAILVVAAASVLYYRSGSSAEEATGSPGTTGGRAGAAFARPPMTVELASAARTPLSERILVVGNLIGAATVDVVPKVSGRLQAVHVRIGDRVSRGQTIAEVEAHEIRQQVKQAEASYEVARATIRQREADLKFADTNLERTRNLFARQLVSRQVLDDAEARQQAAGAQLDLAGAQMNQAKARVDELNITLANTTISSPVDGYLGRRNLDPGAWVSPSTPLGSVVDIHFVRLVVNLVEKDLRRVRPGMEAAVDVDAFPGETFAGRVTRVAPMLDPATRTAQMEVEVANASARLKPGMYARVQITVDLRPAALVVPLNAVVNIDGQRGVFVAADGAAHERGTAGARTPAPRPGTDTPRLTAAFRPVETGLQDREVVEVTRGLIDGERIVTTGAAALRDGDRILLAGQPGRGPRAGTGADGATQGSGGQRTRPPRDGGR